jgi:aldose 1-epimerase
MGIPATGEQHVLTLPTAGGEVTATVTELGASLRRLVVAGTALVQDYTSDGIPSQASGVTLVPWPNRVAGGRWTLEGQPQQLDLTEPKAGNAIHGLLRNSGYRPTDRSESAITLAARVFPQHGYPFLLDVSVRFEVVEDGIAVTHGVHNTGDTRAPVGIGVHPYLRVGDTPMRDLTVHVLADTVFETDGGIPTGTRPVEGTPDDLRAGRPLADADLDTPFTDLALVDGRVRHRLVAPDGRAVELHADPEFAYAQVFTSRIYETDEGRIDAVAIEPMTCAPDALNNGRGLTWLEPGEQLVVSWGIRLLPAV